MQEIFDPLAPHMPGPFDAEDVVGCGETCAPGLPAENTRPSIKRAFSKTNFFAATLQGFRWLGRDADALQSELLADPDHQRCDRRMQMHVLMRVCMMQGQASCGECRKLGADFGRQFAAGGGRKEILKPQGGLISAKFAVRRGDGGKFRVAEQRIAIDQYEVQTGIESRQPFSARNRVRRCGGRDHQTRLRKTAFCTGDLDRFVYGLSETKIIRGKDNFNHQQPRRRSLDDGRAKSQVPA